MSALRLPRGFTAAGIHCGIKRSGRPDLGLIACRSDAVFAATLTTNRVRAAPVKLIRQRLRRSTCRAVVVNSGNANACTGPRGMKDAERMAELAAAALGLEPREVLVCSTGIIGRPLPMEKIEAGIAEAAARLGRGGGAAFARAILTTDTKPKTAAVELALHGRPVRITGIAKGAGMIAPHMATMLAFLLTDAAVEVGFLRTLLKRVVQRTFNRITVDGDQSTNDTVLALASGEAGNRPLREGRPGAGEFSRALEEVCRNLAMMIVRDGEGAQKLVTVKVKGAATAADAERAVRAVAESFLVKASWAGDRANWGRIMDALGYSGARFAEEAVDIYYDGVPAVRKGRPAGTSMEELNRVVRQKEFSVTVNLHRGRFSAVLYTCDLTEEYVRINM